MSTTQLTARFLTALAQAISTRALYEGEHPAVRRAWDAAYEALLRLQEAEARPMITFLGDEIIVAGRPLRELRRWDWGSRLASVGIERLQFSGSVSSEEFERFLDDVYRRLTAQDLSAEARTSASTPIRYGSVSIKGEDAERSDETPQIATLDLRLDEEAKAVRWLHDEVSHGSDLHLMEADAIVRSLSVALHTHSEATLPLLMLREYDEYTTTHAINVSILSMGLAEVLGLGSAAVRHVGIAGLLHDIGKVRIPDEILNKAGKLTDQERSVMEAHPVEGARILVERDGTLDLAAVVAYEHHIRMDGGGYPKRIYTRSCHPVSDLVHICDVYDALRTNRPYRDAWEHERVLDYMAERAGDEFDAELVATFAELMHMRERRAVKLDDEEGVGMVTASRAPSNTASTLSNIAGAAAPTSPSPTPRTAPSGAPDGSDG